jgi:hypothetical protein
MKQKLGFILTAVVIVVVLILINTVSYVGEDEKPDSESAPNRSTYHAGATGTRALYELLNETGTSVMRWRETPQKLLSQDKVKTFVIVGDTKLAIEQEEANHLLHWVAQGGRLVLVDRRPEQFLLPPSDKWNITSRFANFGFAEIDPANSDQMTGNVKAISPAQPTLMTEKIEAVMPSRFASVLIISPEEKEEVASNETAGRDDEEEVEEKPAVVEQTQAKQTTSAPVVHLRNNDGALLLDYGYGSGRIIVLSDPYIFANGGIGLRDNLALAMNILTSGNGLIAFDEYHQGRGTTRNAFVGYFSGTPVLALCGQIVLIVLLVLWTRGRRFARPLPLPRVDRRSSLEFVASMAEVQQRARAFDLAVENIYARTRRVLARYAGVDYNSSRNEIAARVGSRSNVDARQLEVLMKQCEDAINGQPITERQSILLVKRLRDVEAKLGLRMRSRDAKQAAQNI